MVYPWNWPLIAAEGLLVDVRVAGLGGYIVAFVANWSVCF